jgi:hypothetical protein
VRHTCRVIGAPQHREIEGNSACALPAREPANIEVPHIDPRPLDKPTGKPCLEAECELAGYLKTGTEDISPLAVRRIIQIVREGAKDSLDAISLLDKEVYELSESRPNKDPIEQMESVMQMFEDKILE